MGVHLPGMLNHPVGQRPSDVRQEWWALFLFNQRTAVIYCAAVRFMMNSSAGSHLARQALSR